MCFKIIMNGFGQIFMDTLHLTQLLDGCPLHARKPTEVFIQCKTLLFANTWNLFKHKLKRLTVSFLTMLQYRKAMGFISDMHEQMKRCAMWMNGKILTERVWSFSLPGLRSGPFDIAKIRIWSSCSA